MKEIKNYLPILNNLSHLQGSMSCGRTARVAPTRQERPPKLSVHGCVDDEVAGRVQHLQQQLDLVDVAAKVVHELEEDAALVDDPGEGKVDVGQAEGHHRQVAEHEDHHDGHQPPGDGPGVALLGAGGAHVRPLPVGPPQLRQHQRGEDRHRRGREDDLEEQPGDGGHVARGVREAAHLFVVTEREVDPRRRQGFRAGPADHHSRQDQADLGGEGGGGSFGRALTCSKVQLPLAVKISF